jgi:hypothetical protein
MNLSSTRNSVRGSPAWQDAGVDGLNVQYVVSPGTFEDFVDHVAPELRRRGLMQTAYAPGTLREKLFGGGAYLPDEHPAGRSAARRSADLGHRVGQVPVQVGDFGRGHVPHPGVALVLDRR